jgi:GNAT superfamily N-acetyltransferase
MGVDKRFRNQGIGYWICQFCLGLAQEMGKKVACRYVILETDEQKSSYYRKLLFEQSAKKSQKIWMYRRVS